MKSGSPCQNVPTGVNDREPVFWTATHGGRVHPGHSRKMAAKLMSQGHPVLYFENTEGGHSSGSTTAQKARNAALQYAYLWRQLRPKVAPMRPAIGTTNRTAGQKVVGA